jgi:hypothetical protein
MQRGTPVVSRMLLSSAVLAFSLPSLASTQSPPPAPNSVHTLVANDGGVLTLRAAATVRVSDVELRQTK